MAKDFGQAMDNGYMIPSSLSVGSGDAWDIRCQCDTVQDFKTFFTNTGMDIRFEGLVTYEKTNKKLKIYKGNDSWEDVGQGLGGDVDLSEYVTITQLNSLLNNKADKNHVHSYNDLTNKPTIPTVDVTKSYVDTELAKKSNTSHTHSNYAEKSTTYTKTEVDNAIANAQLEGGEVDLSSYAKSVNNAKPDANGNITLQGNQIPCWDSHGSDKGNLHNYIDYLCDHVENHPSSGSFDDAELKAKDAELDNKITVLSDETDVRLDGKSFKYVTQAEYDALSDDDKNNPNIVYGITDATNSGNSYDDTEIRGLINNKVDKINGKQLSTNDFTNEYKNKIDDHLVNHPSSDEIEIKSEDGTIWNLSVSNSGEVIAVKKYIKAEDIILDSLSLKLKKGETQQISFTIVPENATTKNPQWSSSDETVVTVDNGLLTAVSVGYCDITLSVDDVVKKCNVSVSEDVGGLIKDGLILHFDSRQGSDSMDIIEDLAIEGNKIHLKDFTFDGTNGWMEDGGLLFDGSKRRTFEIKNSLGEIMIFGDEDTTIRTIEVFGRVMQEVKGIGGIAHQYSPIHYSRQISKRLSDGNEIGLGMNSGIENIDPANNTNIYRRLNFPRFPQSLSVENGGYFYFAKTDKTDSNIEGYNELPTWKSFLFGAGANTGSMVDTVIYSVRLYNRVLSQEEVEQNFMKDIERYPEILETLE